MINSTNLRFVAVCFVSFVAAPVALIGCEQPAPVVNVQPTETVVVTVPCGETGPAPEASTPVDAGSDNALDTVSDANTDTTEAATDAAPEVAKAQFDFVMDNSALPPSNVWLDSSGVKMLHVKMNNSGKKGGILESIYLLHKGAGASYDISSVTLLFNNGTDSPIRKTCSYDWTTYHASCGALEFYVPAGGSLSFDVEVAYQASGGGGQHIFSINAQEDVVLRGDASATGTFPMDGNPFTVKTEYLNQLAVSFVNAQFNVSLCGKNIQLAKFYLKSKEHVLAMKEQRYEITSTDGGMVVGSSGTPSFYNLRVVEDMSGKVLMGPMGLNTVKKSVTTSGISFSGGYDLHPYSWETIAFVADVACVEDEAGEILGHQYQVELDAPLDGDIYDRTDGVSLPLWRIDGGSTSFLTWPFTMTL